MKAKKELTEQPKKKEYKRFKYVQWETDDIKYRIYDMASREYTQAEMAKDLGISDSGFKKRMRENPATRALYDKGKAMAPSRMRPVVESALEKLMAGYDVVEKKVVKKKNNKGDVTDTTEEIHTRHIPINPTMVIFYCKTKLGYDDGGFGKTSEEGMKLEVIRKIVSSKEDLTNFMKE